MSTVLLIHGGWHGAWYWQKVTPHLEEAGHEVIAPDLPGHGEDKTPPSSISLQDYTDRVVGLLDARSEPVVLAGHSLNGIVISQAAEQRPEKIDKLVYLSAFLLPSGKSAIEVSQEDTESIILQSVDVDEEHGVITPEGEGIRDALYNDCSDEDVEWAINRITPEPLAPFGTPVEVTDANFGSVRRTYIESLRDRAVGPATQKRMYTDLPCEKILSMQTSHFPMFSAPEELARNIDSLAKL